VTTVTLNTTSRPEILAYAPESPAFDVTSTRYADSDGGDQPRALLRNITEQAVIVYADSASARTAINQINVLMNMARDRQFYESGPRVYVKYQASDSDVLWRSETLSGWAELSNAAGTQITINWTRRFWERDSEIQFALTNDASQSGSSLTIFNQYNPASSKVNMVRIAGSQLTGDLPFPARIELDNNFTSDVNDVLIGHQIDLGLGLFPRIEMESQPAGYGLWNGSTEVANSAVSGGKYVNLNVNSQTETLVWSGQLSTALLNACNGEWYTVLAFMAGLPGANDISVRARLSIYGLTRLWDGELIRVPFAQQWLNLGAIQLPGAATQLSGMAPLTLELRARRDVAAAAQLPIDFLMLFPSRQIRKLRNIGYNLPAGYTLVDNQPERVAHIQLGSTNKIINYVSVGNPIMLTPGATNTLWFAPDPAGSILRTAVVRVFGRPRRMTL
jgi:hypothetical protein